MLHTHICYAAHTGGGAEEILNTANYGNYTVPQGQGVYVYAALAMAPANTLSYIRMEADEWDGEDLWIPGKLTTTIDAKDFTYFKRPRYLPGGAILRSYALSNGAQNCYMVILFRMAGPSPSLDRFNGESVIVLMDHKVNSTANIWTTVEEYKFPAQKGPFGVVAFCARAVNLMIGRLIVPQAPNSFRPPVFAYDPAAAGIEGPMLGQLLEPIVVPANETVEVEVFDTAAENIEVWMEYVPNAKRADVPKATLPIVNTGAPSIQGTGTSRAAGIGRRSSGSLQGMAKLIGM